MSRFLFALFLSLALFTTLSTSAADDHAATPAHGATDAHAAVDTAPHPQLPRDTSWVPRLLGITALMFLFAIPTGVVRWMYKRDEPVVADLDNHSHSHEAHEHTSAGLDKHGAKDPHAGHGGHH